MYFLKLATVFLVVLFAPAIFCAMAAAEQTCPAYPATSVIRLTGFTRPQRSMELVSEVAGRVRTVFADVGEAVGESGIFAEIDPTFILLEQEANRLEQQRTRRQLEFDELQVKRYQELLTTKTSAQSRLDELELRRDQTRLALQQLETASKKIEETRLRHKVPAPAGWLIMERRLEPGSWVNFGQPIGKTGDFANLLVPLALTHDELLAIHSQESISLFFPENGLEGNGKILRQDPEFDPATRKTQVDLILLPETLTALPQRRGGIRVEIPLQLPDPLHGIVLPARAVQSRYEEYWVTREDGREARVLVLGAAETPDGQSGAWLRVTGPGLTAGERFRCTPPAP